MLYVHGLNHVFTCLYSGKMNDLLGRYPDLMDGFNEFLARCEKNGNCYNLTAIIDFDVVY